MKLDKRYWALLACILVVFNVLAFLIPFAHTAVFWIAYGCVLIAFAALGYAGNRILKKGKSLDSILFGWPILRVACIGAVAQMIVFLALAALGKICPAWIAVIIEVILLAAEFVGLLFKDTAETVVQHTEQASSDNTATLKRLRAQAAALVRTNTNPALQASLEKLSDALRYADPVSSEATAEIEAQITEKLVNINIEADVIEILRLFNQREVLCKNNKE